MTKEEADKYLGYGVKVTYNPDYGDPEIGMVKRVGNGHAFVVYNCDNNWNDFSNYTAARTSIEDLELGW